MREGLFRVGLVAALLAASGSPPATAQPAPGTKSILKITSPANLSTVDGTRFSVDGTFSSSPTDGVNVVYVVDVSGSTKTPPGQDCNGDGKGTEATPDILDNFNNAEPTGDTLDCEISGLIALNASISAQAKAKVALIPFAGSARAANLASQGPEQVFVPPANDMDGNATADVVQAARSMTQRSIALFSARSVTGGTNFEAAIIEVLRVKALAPDNRTVVFFLSDGEPDVDLSESTLLSLTASGIEVSTYAIGTGTGCLPGESLDKMAKATGRTCTNVTNPASLQGVLGDELPAELERIEVAVEGTTALASVDPIGNWTAEFTGIGSGSKTVTATAFLGDGTQASTSVVVTVTTSSTTTSTTTTLPPTTTSTTTTLPPTTTSTTTTLPPTTTSTTTTLPPTTTSTTTTLPPTTTSTTTTLPPTTTSTTTTLPPTTTSTTTTLPPTTTSTTTTLPPTTTSTTTTLPPTTASTTTTLPPTTTTTTTTTTTLPPTAAASPPPSVPPDSPPTPPAPVPPPVPTPAPSPLLVAAKLVAVASGDSYAVRATGFPGEREVVLTIDGREVGRVMADANGSFDWTLDASALEIGRHRLQARGEGVAEEVNLDVVRTTTISAAGASTVGAVLSFFALMMILLFGPFRARRGEPQPVGWNVPSARARRKDQYADV